MGRYDTIRGITFDAGGTLLYPYPSVGHIYAEVMRAHDLHLGAEELEQAFRQAWKNAQNKRKTKLNEDSEREWWRNLVRDTLTDLGQAKDFDVLFGALWDVFGHPERWRLYDGVIEVLEALKNQGMVLAVLSNWDRRLRGVLEGLDIARFFDHIFISSELGMEKPDAQIFQHAQKHMNVPCEQLLHVGDSYYHDVQPAQDLGWCSLRIQYDMDKDLRKKMNMFDGTL